MQPIQSVIGGGRECQNHRTVYFKFCSHDQCLGCSRFYLGMFTNLPHQRLYNLQQSVGTVLRSPSVDSLALDARAAYRHSVLEQSTIVTLEGSDWTSESYVTLLHI
ncbi:hypothetical protein AVEN_143650-1 [Araneus ventricosus]|uniref:Uncharacterized protein n=1 Tax=Araneus ventricosus TaxID=182803 RepID=A0A4Y2AN66_ARAVE|nr:hypothetical protein AVEN_143650-1 [Araneus ventricosus]